MTATSPYSLPIAAPTKGWSSQTPGGGGVVLLGRCTRPAPTPMVQLGANSMELARPLAQSGRCISVSTAASSRLNGNRAHALVAGCFGMSPNGPQTTGRVAHGSAAAWLPSGASQATETWHGLLSPCLAFAWVLGLACQAAGHRPLKPALVAAQAGCWCSIAGWSSAATSRR